LGDIYYLLFRHKWKIIICSLFGLLGAFLAFKFNAPPYQSQAKLFIRYVLDSQGSGPIDSTNMKVTSDQRGETIINAEVQILGSMDLAKDVAQAIGPEKLAPGAMPGKELLSAAVAVHLGLEPEIEPRSNVLKIVFSHPNKEIVQPVLQEILERYLKKHVEVHQTNGLMGELLSKETDQLRAKLANTEEELRKIRSKSGIISPEESKKAYAEMISHLKQEIFTAQAQLAEHTAIFQATKDGLPPEQADSGAGPQIPETAIQSHKDIVTRIEILRKQEQELLIQFTPENTRVKDTRSLLAEAVKRKTQLETDYPQIVRYAVPVTGANKEQFEKNRVQVADEGALLASLEAKIKTLRQQYEQIQAEAAALDQMESSITELRRQKELEEKNYLEYSSSLAKSRSAEALTSDRVSNISQIESPTPPFREWKKALKLMAGIAAGGLILGLGWAVLFEFFLDRSVRRPNDVERSLKLPLFLAIPRLVKGLQPDARPSSAAKLLKDSEASTTSQLVVAHDESHVLNPYFETLRDRLIAYFESVNMRHRPKLIAVTGLGRESGVSTTAAGLARSLSETGEGNVLLVDMTQKKGEGTAMPFYQGKAIADIDYVLSSRASEKSENKLFIASEGSSSETLSRQLPQRFSQLVPKLKASNFDYIIFDMPPVSQISVTPRLAGAMDMVLMVVESEKTDREMAQRAATMLSKANANVGVILNKTKTYVPGKLFKDREFFLDS